MNTLFALLVSIGLGLIFVTIILFIANSYTYNPLYTIPHINEFIPLSPEGFDNIPRNIYTYDANGVVSDDFKESIEKYTDGFTVTIYTDEMVPELFKPFGRDAIRTYFRLGTSDKEKFVAYALMFLKGGYYINKNVNLTNSISNINIESTLFCNTNDGIKLLVSKKNNHVFYDLINSSSFHSYIIDIQESSVDNVKKMSDKPVCDTSVSTSCNTTYISQISYNGEEIGIYHKFSKNWLNAYVDSVYIISMPNRIDYMSDFMNIINQHNFDFVEPIDKKTIINPYEYTKNLKLTPGKIACHLSHIKALKQFLSSDNETCMIFEDDLMLPYDIDVEKSVDNFFANLPKDWEILFLGRCWDWCHESIIYNEYVCSNPRPLCRHAYVVNKSGAQKLVDLTNTMYLEAGDHMYADLVRNGTLTSYSPLESLFTQNRTTLSTQVMYTNPNPVTCNPSLTNNRKKTINVISTRSLRINEKNQFDDNKRVPYYYIIQSSGNTLVDVSTLEQAGVLEADKEKYSDEFIIVNRDDFFIYNESDIFKKTDLNDNPKYKVLNKNNTGTTTTIIITT